MLGADPVRAAADVGRRRAADRRRGAAALLAAVSRSLTVARDPRLLRERFESELRTLVKAKAVDLRDDPVPPAAPRAPLTVAVPSPSADWRARIEAIFDGGVTPDDWTYQLLEMAAHVGTLILEIERAHGYGRRATRPLSDGAAPLIGSSAAIRSVRERIERVALTDFTLLIEGAIGPESHPSFIEVFCEVAFGDGDGEVARTRTVQDLGPQPDAPLIPYGRQASR